MRVTDYTFDASAGTITFNDLSSLELPKVDIITNLTTGSTLYQFNKVGLGGSVSAGSNILNLTLDTSTMSDTDNLKIIYDETPQVDLNNYQVGSPTRDMDDDNDARRVVGTKKEFTALSTSTVGDLLAQQDMGPFQAVSVHLSGTYTATIAFLVSTDGTNWENKRLVRNLDYVISGTTTGVGLWFGNVIERFFKISVTAISSGTVNATVELTTYPLVMPFILGSTQENAGGIAGLVRVGITDGTLTRTPRGSVNGVQIVSIGGISKTAIAASTSTNTQVKTGVGRLANVLVTTLGTNAMLFYDNTAASGTIIGAIPASAPVGSLYHFNFPCSNGILAAGNAANPAVTVGWE
jgi:hypothetical protein